MALGMVGSPSGGAILWCGALLVLVGEFGGPGGHCHVDIRQKLFLHPHGSLRSLTSSLSERAACLPLPQGPPPANSCHRQRPRVRRWRPPTSTCRQGVATISALQATKARPGGAFSGSAAGTRAVHAPPAGQRQRGAWRTWRCTRFSTRLAWPREILRRWPGLALAPRHLQHKQCSLQCQGRRPDR